MYRNLRALLPENTTFLEGKVCHRLRNAHVFPRFQPKNANIKSRLVWRTDLKCVWRGDGINVLRSSGEAKSNKQNLTGNFIGRDYTWIQTLLADHMTAWMERQGWTCGDGKGQGSRGRHVGRAFTKHPFHKKHPISKNKDRKAAFNCRVLFIIQPTMSIKQNKKKKEKVEGYDRRGIRCRLYSYLQCSYLYSGINVLVIHI